MPDYFLYGKEPDGVHVKNFKPEFLTILNDIGLKPRAEEIREILDNLELDGLIQGQSVSYHVASGDGMFLQWKKYSLTTKGRKYLRSMENIVK